MSMEVPTSAILFIVTILFYFLWKIKSKMDEKRRNLPKSLGFFNTLSAMKQKDRYRYFAAHSKRTKEEMLTFKVFHKEVIVINSYKIMKEVLVTQANIFSARPYNYVINVALNNTDLLFASGPLHKEKRRFVLHHFRNLGIGKSSMEDKIHEQTSILLRDLEEKDGQEVEIESLFNSTILNVLWSITAGKMFKQDDPKIAELFKVTVELMDKNAKIIPINLFPFLRFLPGDPFSFWEVLQRGLHRLKFYESEVEEHIRTFQKADLRDFIDIYLEKIFENESNNNSKRESCFQKKHLLGILDSLFTAGTETTATTLEWSILYMALWPEIQTKIQQELDTVVGRHRRPNYADRKMLPYTEATVMEIYRYCTLIPFMSISPTVTTNVNGYTIPKRTMVVGNIWAVHNDKDIFGDPEVFRPERFITAEGNVQTSEYLIPFSIGSRNCVGESLARMEVFLIFTTLLQSLTFRCVTGEPLPSLKPIVTVTQRPEPFAVTVRKR